MLAWYRICPFLGRVGLAGVFLFSGWSKFADWEPMAADMTAKVPSFPAALLPVAGGIEIAVAAFLLLGIRTRAAAAVLILYLIPTTILFHAFWAADGAAAKGETIQFLKNLAIIGGLLHAAAPVAPQPLFIRK